MKDKNTVVHNETGWLKFLKEKQKPRKGEPSNVGEVGYWSRSGVPRRGWTKILGPLPQDQRQWVRSLKIPLTLHRWKISVNATGPGGYDPRTGRQDRSDVSGTIQNVGLKVVTRNLDVVHRINGFLFVRSLVKSLEKSKQLLCSTPWFFYVSLYTQSTFRMNSDGSLVKISCISSRVYIGDHMLRLLSHATPILCTGVLFREY